MQNYLHPASLPLDTYHEQSLDGDDTSTIDDFSLDANAADNVFELSPAMDSSRRQSFATGPSLFSPKAEDWQSVEMQSVPSNNPFLDQHTGNNFLRMDQDSAQNLHQQGNVWSLPNSASGASPQHIDGLASDFDTHGSIFQRMSQTHMPFTHPGNMFASLPAEGSAVQTQSAASLPKSGRPASPTLRTHNELRRGDGIRKRNARFDIPAEHNLTNIDHLISQSTDEQEIKELKQQKRLLRNRQAALDSRQRKKLHTERLEDEKKQFTAAIGELDMELNGFKSQVEQLRRENQSYANYVETLTVQKDEMIRAHTIEARELRKKLSVLTEHIQRLESNNVVTPTPSGNAFGGLHGDLDGMAMPGAWDSMNFMGDYDMDAESKQTLSMVPAKKTENSFVADSAKSSQGGLLFMLFLVGAFVMSSRSTPSIPRVSEDIRVASAALLDNVLKDAGIGNTVTDSQAIMPQPSGANWQNPSAAVDRTRMNHDGNARSSMLSELGDSLIQPSEEQTNEQIFSISAAQYNGVSSHDFMHHPINGLDEPSGGRKNLAAALEEIRTASKQSGVADVYTRSLLWDQIPSEVVRDFAKMVAESNDAGQNEQQQCRDAIL